VTCLYSVATVLVPERETVRFQDLLFEVDIPALLTEHPIGIAPTAAPGQPWIRSIAGLVEMRCIHERHHMNRIIQWKRAKFGGTQNRQIRSALLRRAIGHEPLQGTQLSTNDFSLDSA
jgi:hypothetical protein